MPENYHEPSCIGILSAPFLQRTVLVLRSNKTERNEYFPSFSDKQYCQYIQY